MAKNVTRSVPRLTVRQEVNYSFFRRQGILTKPQIAKQLGISYATLVRATKGRVGDVTPLTREWVRAAT